MMAGSYRVIVLLAIVSIQSAGLFAADMHNNWPTTHHGEHTAHPEAGKNLLKSHV